MRRQRFEQDEDATIEIHPPEGPVDAAPAPTVSVFTPSNSVITGLEDVAATADPFDTTIAVGQDAEEGDDQVIATSGTNAKAGRRVWIGTINEDPLELMRILSVNGSTVKFTGLLSFDHAAGQDVKGQGLTRAVPAAALADLDRNYRIEWKYSVDGVEFRPQQLFDVVKYVFRLPIDEEDLRGVVPEDLRQRSAELLIDDLVRLAEQKLELELSSREVRIDLVRDPDQFELAGVYACKEILLERAASTDSDYRQPWRDAQGQFLEAMGDALSDINWYDVDEDDRVDQDLLFWDFGARRFVWRASTAGGNEEGYTAGNYFRRG